MPHRIVRPAAFLAASIVLASCGGGGAGAVRPASPATAQSVATVTVSPSAPSLAAGSTVQLSATATDSANNVVASPSVTWSSSDAALASVSATNVVTGIAAGHATISAASGGKVGSAT